MVLSEAELRPMRERQKLKRQKNAIFMSNEAQFIVLGNGSPGMPRSLCLRTTHEMYLFNCGEGCQRVLTESSTQKSIGRLNNVFFTSAKWMDIGGLTCLLLSVRMSGSPGVKVHGPKQVADLFNAMDKSYFMVGDFVAEHYDQASLGVYSDASLSVEAFPISPPNAEDPHALDDSDDDEIVKSALLSAYDGSEADLNKESAIDMSTVAYMVTFPAMPGRLDVAECTARGVPKGPLLGQLKQGQDVTLADGTTVTSASVTSPGQTASTCVILDLPTSSHVEAFLADDKLASKLNCCELEYIFHMVPQQVFEQVTYQTWLKGVGPGVQHVVLNDTSGCNTAQMKFFTHNQTLRSLSTDLFPYKLDLLHVDRVIGSDSPTIVHGGYLDKFSVRPTASIQLCNADGRDRCHTNGEQRLQPDGAAYPRITCLGTGSSIPLSYRNVSGYLVESEPDRFILFDCGEGTLIQLYRAFGVGGTHTILANLNAVFISHLHLDHQIGLVGLLADRFRLIATTTGSTVSTLFLMTSVRHLPFLRLVHRHFQPILAKVALLSNDSLLIRPDVVPREWLVDAPTPPSDFGCDDEGAIDTSNVRWNPGSDDATKLKSSKERLSHDLISVAMRRCGLSHLATCKALHTKHSYCISLTVTSNRFRIMYSGDTRPTDSIVRLARSQSRPVDVLIHEATLVHASLADAQTKRHSTFDEAIHIGIDQICARCLVLSHFSQRYPKFATLVSVERPFATDRVVVASDFMRLSPSNLGAVAHFMMVAEKHFVTETELNSINASDVAQADVESHAKRLKSQCVV